MNRNRSAPASTPSGRRDFAAETQAAVHRFLDQTDESELVALLSQWGGSVPFGSFVIGPTDSVDDGTATVTLWDSDDPVDSRWPFRARLSRNDDGAWRLKDIRAQCASCFGLGVVERGRACETCDGGGWGVLTDQARSLISRG